MGCAVSVEGVANAPPNGEVGSDDKWQNESGDKFNCPSNQKQNESSHDQILIPSQQQQEGQQRPQSSQLRSAYVTQGSIQSGATIEGAGGNGNDASVAMKPVLPLDDDDATSTTFGHIEDHINRDNTVPAVGAAHNIRKLTAVSSPSHAQSHTPESVTPSKKETNMGLGTVPSSPGNAVDKGTRPQEGNAAEGKKVDTSTNNRSALFAGGDPLFASSLRQEQPSAPLSVNAVQTEKEESTPKKAFLLGERDNEASSTHCAHETTNSPLPAAEASEISLRGRCPAAPSAPSALIGLGGEGVIDGNALLAGDDTDDESGEYEMPEEQGMAEPPPFASSDGPAAEYGVAGGGGMVMVDMMIMGGGGKRSKSKGRSTENNDFDEESSSDCDGELAEPTDHGAVKVIEQAPDRYGGGGGFVLPGPSPTVAGAGGGGGEAVTRDRYGIVMAVRNADEALYARAVASKQSEQLTNNLLEDFEKEFASPPSTLKATSSSPNTPNVNANGKTSNHPNAQTSDHRQDDALAPFKVEEPSPPPISQSPPTHSLKPQPPSQPPNQVPAPVRSTSANGVSTNNNNNNQCNVTKLKEKENDADSPKKKPLGAAPETPAHLSPRPVGLMKEKPSANEESSFLQQDDLKSEKSKKEKKKKSGGTSKSPAKGSKKTKAVIISSSSSSEDDNSNSSDEDTPPPSDDSEDENKTTMSAAAKKAKGAAAIALRRLREKKKKEKEEKKKNNKER